MLRKRRTRRCIGTRRYLWKTILATGNGRCNFANEQLLPERYNNPSFVKQILDNGLAQILELFNHVVWLGPALKNVYIQ